MAERRQQSGGSSGKVISEKVEEELTELRRKKGEMAQQLIDLRNSYEYKETDPDFVKDAKRQEFKSKKAAMKDKKKSLEQAILEREETIRMLTDERQELATAGGIPFHREGASQRQSYTASFKLKVVAAARETTPRDAACHHNVSVTSVREWIKNEDRLKNLLPNRRRCRASDKEKTKIHRSTSKDLINIIRDIASESFSKTVTMVDIEDRCANKGYKPDQIKKAIEEYEALDVVQVNATRTQVTLV